MEGFVSQEVLDGLRRAEKLALGRKNRLRVHAGDEVFRVLELWEDGFTIASEDAPHLRGLVDIYDGARHISQCLVMRSESDGGVVTCEFKWQTPAREDAPRDFVVDEDAPVGYLTAD